MRRFITGVLVLNSILAGVLTFSLFCALGAVSLVVDQEVGLREVTAITQWVFDHTPRHLFTVVSLSVGVTATCLFCSLACAACDMTPQRTTLHFLYLATLGLAVLVCFFLSSAAILTSLVRVYGDLYVAGQTPHVHAHSSQHLHGPVVDPRIWVAAATVYSLVLLCFGLRIARKRPHLQEPCSRRI
jgi:hypothetical protein